MIKKYSIRQSILALRNKKSNLASSLKICNNFLNKFSGFSSYGLYSSFGSEVTTFSLFLYLIKQGKKIYYPKVKNDKIIFLKCLSLYSLHKGYNDILEPEESSTEGIPEIIVTPGIAFDIKGVRVGYGKGYYDRYFSLINSPLKIGLAFEFQVTENLIESHPHDVKLDFLVTENKIYSFN